MEAIAGRKAIEIYAYRKVTFVCVWEIYVKLSKWASWLIYAIFISSLYIVTYGAIKIYVVQIYATYASRSDHPHRNEISHLGVEYR